MLLDRLEAGRAERGIILTGLRGVGKTVLLEELRSTADQRDWVVAFVEAGSSRPFRLLAAPALTSSLRATSLRHRSSALLRGALGVFKSFSLRASRDRSVSVGIDVDPVAGRADSGDLELDLTQLLVDLGEAAAKFDAGVLLLVDELQELPQPDVAAIAGAAHQTNRLRLPVTVAGAGLPNLPTVLTEAKSYASGSSPTTVSALSTRATPPMRSGAPAGGPRRGMATRRLDHAVAASGGYPYFLQAFGKKIWDYSPGPDIITAEDAAVGVAAAQSELDDGFYGSRWERATPAQRSYLSAMAAESDNDSPVSSGEVAGRLGKPHSDLGPHREQLIRKGLIYAPERGLVAFTVLGMSAYIRRIAT